MMNQLPWTPVLFWFGAGLTLIPAGIAIALTDVKKSIVTGLISQAGIFLLMLSLGFTWPAFIYLIPMLFLTLLTLYGNQIFPSRESQEIPPSHLTTIAKAGLSAVLFIFMIVAFYRSIPDELTEMGNSVILRPVIPDISLLLILFGLILILIFMAVSHLFKRK